MWKPLSIVSGLLLIGAGGIMYTVVRPEFKSELLQKEASEKNLISAKENKDKSDATNRTAKSDQEKSVNLVATNTGERDNAKKAKAEVVAKVEETQKAKDTAEKALADLQSELNGLGGLEQVVARLKELEAKKAQLETDKKNTQEATTAFIAHKESTDKVITALKIREIYQKTGTVKEGTSSRITEASPELGFFILAHGNSSNITKNSKWDVVRGEMVIARVVVTHIEQNRSTAELVPGTLVSGYQVLPGDRVVVSSSSTPRALAASITAPAKPGAAKPGAPKPDGAAPAGETPVADPFAAPDGGATPMETPPAPAPAPAETPAPPADAPTPAPANP
jgi:hypothetical protein